MWSKINKEGFSKPPCYSNSYIQRENDARITPIFPKYLSKFYHPLTTINFSRLPRNIRDDISLFIYCQVCLIGFNVSTQRSWPLHAPCQIQLSSPTSDFLQEKYLTFNLEYLSCISSFFGLDLKVNFCVIGFGSSHQLYFFFIFSP